MDSAKQKEFFSSYSVRLHEFLFCKTKMKSDFEASKKTQFEYAGKYSRQLFHAINPTGLSLNKNIKMSSLFI